MGKFELFKNVIGNYGFRLKAPDSEIILANEGYVTRQGAQNGIDAVKRYAANAPVVDLT